MGALVSEAEKQMGETKQSHGAKSRSEYTPIRRRSQDEDEEEKPGRKRALGSTRKNQLVPPEGGKQGQPGAASSSEWQVASVTVSGNKGDASPRTIEVQISSAFADDKSEQTPQAEDDTMGKAK